MGTGFPNNTYSKIMDILVEVRVFRVTLISKKNKGAGIPRTSFLFEAGWALRAEEEKHGKNSLDPWLTILHVI
jgi:hypothetical protein